MVEFHAGVAVEQEGARAGLGRVADELDASGELARQEAEVDEARRAQMETERAGDEHAVHLRDGVAGGGKERLDAGAHGGLGELHLADVLLRKVNGVGEAERGLAVDCGEAVFPRTVGRGAVGAETTIFVHAAMRGEFADGVEQAAAAQAGRRGVADGAQLDGAAGERDELDGAATGAHAAGDVHALEGGTGGGGGGDEFAVGREDHLAVGADIDEEGDAAARREVGREQSRSDVGADVGGHDWRQINLAAGREFEADGGGGDVVAAEKLRRVGILAERGGIGGGRQVQHGGVAAEDGFVNPGAVDLCFGGGLGEEAVQLGDQLGVERAQALGRGAEFDAREHILRVARLRVERGGGGELAAVAQIHEGDDERGRADVDGGAVGGGGGVAGLGGHDRAAGDDSGAPRDRIERFLEPRLDVDGDGLAVAEDFQPLVFLERDFDAEVAIDESLAGERPAGVAVGLRNLGVVVLG